MLETRNLRKVYTPKKGVPVTALDGVSLKFPERGMVFLLGKSGSGKSTLLNLLGGLDKYDEGEIIIKGVSSRDFSQERFDSYRNTYVGFIFQDYNILEEFSVGANIALAIELQGKKATDAEINKILKEVDLVGYGNRKPNELSGGQLQRVAIARALIKDPEIIMADEPTGALDSGTGKQVFDTLKKLSADKLVIIVSHDREYAEFYADRIIELADGHVISDVEYAKDDGGDVESISFDGDTVTVPAGYHLTEEDRAEINAYIDRIKSGTKLHFSGLTKKFRNTDTSAIPPQDPSKFALIKSRLPLHSAFRIGASGLKHKKFRLAVTVILSVVAFTLFALADTFGAYDHITTCTDSLVDSGINYLSFNKAKKYIRSYDGSIFWDDWGYKIDESDIAEIAEGVGVPVSGVYTPDRRLDSPLSFRQYVHQDNSLYSEGSYNIYPMSFGGFTEASKEVLDSAGCTLTAGRLPEEGKHELAITEYTASTFRLGGFSADGGDVYDKIAKSSDLIGRTLNLCDIDFEIVGIIDTHFDFDRYKPLTKDDSRLTDAERLTMYVLLNELDDVQTFSLDNLAYVSRGMIAELASNEPPVIPTDGFSFYLNQSSEDFNCGVSPNYVGRLADIPDSVKDRIVWADGRPRDTLGEKEVVVSSSVIYCYDFDTGSTDITSDMYDTILGLDFEAGISSGISYDTYEGYRIVGIIGLSSESEGGSVVFPDSEDPDAVDELMEGQFAQMSAYLPDALYDELTDGYRGLYASAVGAMPKDEAGVRRAVSFAYREDADTRFPLQNPVTYELDIVNEILEQLSVWFLWIGVGFAVFAAIMLANFIGTSIAYKKQEIGILRAIGSRSSDVFHIFFAEGFIIAVTNFVLASIATFVVTAVINGVVRSNVGLLITILHFGIRQTALLIVVSLAVAAISCFLPVKRIASKRPIDAIRGR